MSPIATVLFPLACIGCMVAGVLIVTRRKKLWADTRDRQRRLVGRHVSRAFERLQNSFWIGAVGVFAVLSGAAFLVRYVLEILT